MTRFIPPFFISGIKSTLSDITDTALMTEALLEGEPVVSVRNNSRKPSTELWNGMEQVKWCDCGFYLPERPNFTLIPELHQGRFYVQDASSMFIRWVLKQLCAESTDPLIYLDACAAPGGKTTAAIDVLPEGSLVVANEYDPRRAAILRENLVKWGYPDLIITQGDTAAFRKAGEMFNIIAADVPCSGEGMMRKDEEAARQWSLALVKECLTRQREIIANLWDALLPGGYFIYSTCTYNKLENERMVEWIADSYEAESVEINLPADSGILVTAPREGIFCYRFMPHLLRGEGLFMAVLRKPGESSSAAESKKVKTRKTSSSKQSPQLKQVEQWVRNRDEYVFSIEGDTVNLFPRRYLPQLELMRKKARVLQSGVAVANIKGKDMIPEHALAMSELFNEEVFPKVDLTFEDALKFLRRDVIDLPADTPRGYVTVTYNGFPLGFVKNLGNRSNNLYPQGWKIRLSLT